MPTCEPPAPREPTSPRAAASAVDPLTAIVVAVGADRSGRALAAAISRLARSQGLAAGTRLPTVRVLAGALGTSPVTVSQAWQALARAGVIESRGRLGSFVRERPRPARRYARVAGDPQGPYRMDLASGTPDPTLLPDLGPALARVGRRAETTSYLDDPVLASLAEVLRDSWPFAPGALTVVDGALDALDRLSSLLVGLGDRVVVENPTFPGLLDLLEHRRAEIVPVPVDARGLVPHALAAVLTDAPVAVFLQPRAHNPTGAGLTRRRAGELASVLRPYPGVMVIEDDHSGDIARAPDVSLGRHLPGRTVRIRSYSKSHGPDLRLAAVGGPAEVIDAVARRRRLGPGWSSRLLQAVLVDLLSDPDTVAQVAAARAAYAARRTAVRSALARRGVFCPPGDGVNLWVPVAEESSAVVALAAAGIRVSPGSAFVLADPGPGAPSAHLRVTSGLLRGGEAEITEVADLLARAARGR